MRVSATDVDEVLRIIALDGLRWFQKPGRNAYAKAVNPKLTPEDIARHPDSHFRDTLSVLVAVDKLENEGLLEYRNGTKGRHEIVKTTDKGRRYLAARMSTGTKLENMPDYDDTASPTHLRYASRLFMHSDKPEMVR